MSLPIIVFGFLVVIGIVVFMRLTVIGQNFEKVTRVLEPQADQAAQLIDVLRERARQVEIFLRIGDRDTVIVFDNLVEKSDQVEQKLRELTVNEEKLRQLEQLLSLIHI